MDAAYRKDVPPESGLYRIVNLSTGCEYVGSAANLAQRRRQHKSSLAHGRHVNRRLQRAWDKLGPNAFRFDVVELAPRSELLAREQALLDSPAEHGRYNVMLVAGHGPGALASPETRAKMSAAKKGRKLSPEHRAKIAAAGRGRTMSPETRARLAEANRGRAWTAEQRAVLRAKCSGYRHTDEAKAKIAASGRGRRWSETTKARLSAAARAQMADPAARERISRANTGRLHTEETRAKMRAAWIRRKAARTAVAG